MAGRYTLLILLVLLTGCERLGSPPAAPSSVHRYASASQCLSALFSAGATFRRTDDFRDAQGCGIEHAVILASASSGLALGPPARMSCDLAAALTTLTREVIQPEAIRLLGQPVIRIGHFGTYNCRNRAPGRLSEHAKGRAIDISGFELADGSTVLVERDWRGAGAKSDFLRRVGRKACDHVSLVLGPGHDRKHRNHLHLDIGEWALCAP